MTSSTTSPWSAAVRPGLPPRSMRRPKDCRSRCSMRARSAARPAPARGSKTISAFRPAFPARRWPAAPSTRRRNSAPRCMIPVSVKSLDCVARDGAFALATRMRRSRCAPNPIVVASGARYRRPEIENLDDFEGRGVWYWASPIEAQLCAGQEVVLVGGGNSAGQAAVFLSGHAAQGPHDDPRRRARRQHVALSDRAHRGDAEHRTDVQHRSGRGSKAARTARSSACAGAAGWRRREHSSISATCFCSSAPIPRPAGSTAAASSSTAAASWSPARSASRIGDRPVPPLETSVPGVFAVGDVRSGSVKRVGGAIGEGAQVVAALHGFLGRCREAVAVGDTESQTAVKR